MLLFYLQTIVSNVTANHDRDVYLQANEPAVVKIQAHWKGHKAKKEYQERKHFIFTHLPAIIRIQVNKLIYLNVL